MKLISDECRVETVTEEGTSRIVCITPKEKCQKARHYPEVKVLVGEFSIRCMTSMW